MRQKTKERKKRMRKVEEGRGSETRALRPPPHTWLGWTRETWTFTLCTDSITDCVPIYHSMSVRETQGRSDNGGQSRSSSSAQISTRRVNRLDQQVAKHANKTQIPTTTKSTFSILVPLVFICPPTPHKTAALLASLIETVNSTVLIFCFFFSPSTLPVDQESDAKM